MSEQMAINKRLMSKYFLYRPCVLLGGEAAGETAEPVAGPQSVLVFLEMKWKNLCLVFGKRPLSGSVTTIALCSCCQSSILRVGSSIEVVVLTWWEKPNCTVEGGAV